MLRCVRGSWRGCSCGVAGGVTLGAVSSGLCWSIAAFSSALMVAGTSWSMGEVGGCGNGLCQVRW